MSFVHPGIFWIALGAVGVPILIHLLNRRRFRPRDWAAMRFVREAFRRHRRRLQIEQLILLAVRCLAVLLLGLALARFVGCGALAMLPGADELRTTVFILDDSVSMGQRAGGVSTFALAAGDLVEQLAALGDGEKVAIRRAGDPDEAPLFPMGFVTDRASLVAKLRTLTAGDTRSDLAATVRDAADELLQQPGPKRLVLFSDFRAADLGDDRRADVTKAFEPLLAADVDVVAIDYGRPAEGNLTAVSLALVDKFIVAGSPARLAVVVGNRGPLTARDVEIGLTMLLPSHGATDEGKPVTVKLPTIELDAVEPGGERRLEFNVTVPDAGSVVVSAELPPDELEGDNAAWLALDVRRALRVLVVDGRPNAIDPPDSESFTFAAAVDPSGSADAGMKADVIDPGDLPAVDLADYDAVALLNVAELPGELNGDGSAVYPQLTALVQYVRTGGGLLIATGERVNLSFYNGPLFAGGAGLSPFRLGPPTGDPNRPDRFVRLDPKSIDPAHPVVRTFAGEGAVLTRFIRFFAFTPAEVINDGSDPAAGRDVSAPQVLARFADEAGSPAIVSRLLGQGRVVFIYTTVSTRWNDWADDQPPGIYVAPVQDLIRYLVRGQASPTGARVSEPIRYVLPESFRSAEATLKMPSFPTSDLVLLRPIRGTRPAALRYERAAEAGLYVLSLQNPDGRRHDVLLARTVDPVEGRLEPAGRDRLAGAIGSDDFTYVSRATSRATAAFSLGKSELWLWLVLAAAALLATETILARRFGHYTTTARAAKPEGAAP